MFKIKYNKDDIRPIKEFKSGTICIYGNNKICYGSIGIIVYDVDNKCYIFDTDDGVLYTDSNNYYVHKLLDGELILTEVDNGSK